jgi:di/tripeptidase
MIRGFIDEAVVEENAFWAESGKSITVEHIVIGDRPAGAPPADSDIVQTACAAIGALGGEPKLAAPASTNANVPISQNVPAVVLRTGGTREGNHTLDEWYNPDGSQRGVKLALLMVLALCGME